VSTWELKLNKVNERSSILLREERMKEKVKKKMWGQEEFHDKLLARKIKTS
jgi:hypothetical protein